MWSPMDDGNRGALSPLHATLLLSGSPHNNGVVETLNLMQHGNRVASTLDHTKKYDAALPRAVVTSSCPPAMPFPCAAQPEVEARGHTSPRTQACTHRGRDAQQPRLSVLLSSVAARCSGSALFGFLSSFFCGRDDSGFAVMIGHVSKAARAGLKQFP